MAKFLDLILEKRYLVSIITVFTIITITIIVVYFAKKKQVPLPCNPPKCNPCVYGNPSEWTKECDKRRLQYRIIPVTGILHTDASNAKFCVNKQETRPCEYKTLFVFLKDSCISGNTLLTQDISTAQSFNLDATLATKVKQISVPTYLTLDSYSKLVIINDEGVELPMTQNPFCIPDGFVVKSIKLTV